MSNWITDRQPTISDGASVWVDRGGVVRLEFWGHVKYGEPWQPHPKPEPYLKPKVWTMNVDGMVLDVRKNGLTVLTIQSYSPGYPVILTTADIQALVDALNNFEEGNKQ